MELSEKQLTMYEDCTFLNEELLDGRLKGENYSKVSNQLVEVSEKLIANIKRYRGSRKFNGKLEEERIAKFKEKLKNKNKGFTTTFITTIYAGMNQKEIKNAENSIMQLVPNGFSHHYNKGNFLKSAKLYFLNSNYPDTVILYHHTVTYLNCTPWEHQLYFEVKYLSGRQKKKLGL